MNMRLIINRFDTGSVRSLVWVLLWCVAIVIGIFIAVHTAIVTTPLLNNTIANSISPIGLILSSGCILLLTGVALNRSSMLTVCSLILLTGVSKGFAGKLIYLVFGSGAWLLRFALFFTSSIVALFMWWLLFKHYKQTGKSLYRDYLSVAILMGFTFILDIFVISPFVIGLFI